MNTCMYVYIYEFHVCVTIIFYIFCIFTIIHVAIVTSNFVNGRSTLGHCVAVIFRSDVINTWN